jgi:hypothetical protein
MMGQETSSPATDHRFSPIIGCSAVAGTAGNRFGPICDPCDPCVTHAGQPMGHSISVSLQCLDYFVTHVTHKHLNKTLGDDTAAAGQHMGSDWGGMHVSGGNIGKYGSHGSHGSQVGGKRSSPPFDHGSSPMGPGRGDTDPRKNSLCKNFRNVGPRYVTT